MMLLMVNVTAFADDEAKIEVSGAEAKAGETVEVTVSLENNPGIISMLLSVTYDRSAMTLKEVKDAGILGESLHSNNLGVNPYILFWSNGTAKSDITANGTIATLMFEISENAVTGDYPIKVSYDKKQDGIFNFDMDPVDFAIENGSISVEGIADSGQHTGGSKSGGGYVAKPDDEKTPTEDTDEQETEFVDHSGDVLVTVNGKFLVFVDQKPVIVGDRTLVPLRAIFETLGANVKWDDAAKTVTANRGDVEISLTIGSDRLYVNGAEKIVDVPAQIINSRTMVPIRVIAESFGCNVEWNEENRTVIVTE